MTANSENHRILVRRAKAMVGAATISCFVFFSVACTKGFWLRFSDVVVGPAFGEAKVVTDRDGHLHIESPELLLMSPGLVYIYSPPKEDGGRLSVRFVVGAAGYVPTVQSMILTPIKYKAPKNTTSIGAIHADMVDEGLVDAQELEFPRTNLKETPAGNKELRLIRSVFMVPYFVTKARVDLILDAGDGLTIPVSFTVTRS